MEPFNAERIEAQVTDNRALSVALREIGRLARVVEEQSGRIESLEGPNVKRDSDPEPDAEPPYRMTRPTNRDALGHGGSHRATRMWDTPYRMAEPTKIGASVISDGTVFTRTDNSDTPWRQHHDLGLAPLRWDWIRSPQPYQNCRLTADDPEPPVGSIVQHDGGTVSKRYPTGWLSIGLSDSFLYWREEALKPVTLLYRGEA